MKKILAIILATVMLMSLVSCDLEKLEELKDLFIDEDEMDFGEFSDQSSKTVIDDVIVFDDAEYLIKVNSIGTNYSGDLTVGVYIENKSSTKSYTVSTDSASINGVVCDSTLYSTVSPGKKANDEVYFSDELLRKFNVGDYTDIEITFEVREENNYNLDPVKKTVHIYPKGEDNAVKYTRESKSTDQLIIDNQYVTAVIVDYSEDEGGYVSHEVFLYIVNKTSQVVWYETEEVSVNGFMVNELCLGILGPGECTYDELYFTEDDIEENGIGKVEEIEFILSVYDVSSWGGPDGMVYETVKFNP